MPLRYFRNKETKEVKRTLKKSLGKDWEEVIKSPNGKFMVMANPATNTSKIKDLKPMLHARAKNHSRDVDLDDNIQLNKSIMGENENIHKNFFNETGKRKTKLDDL